MNIMNLFKKNINRIDPLARDITGKCDGECRDRVKESGLSRQYDINLSSVEEIESYPEVELAHVRNEPPGVWGGHV